MHENTLKFPVDTILKSSEICNLEDVYDEIRTGVEAESHMVLYGRRNTGKSSLVMSKLVDSLHKSGYFIVAVDFLNTLDESDLASRMQKALEKALTKTFPKKNLLKETFYAFKTLRPNVSVDPMTGELNLSLTSATTSTNPTLDEIFDQIVRSGKGKKILILMDEFQDLSRVKKGVAQIRTALQNLPSKVPVVILGSKKHILHQIFGRHGAPMAGWGREIEVKPILHEKYIHAYWKYCQMRFKTKGIELTLENLKTLLVYVQGIPESANIVCDYFMRHYKNKILTEDEVKKGIARAADERRARFEEMYGRLKSNERAVLVAVAKYGPVPMPKSKEFLGHLPGMAPSSVFQAITTLEDAAEIYREDRGYVIAEPLLGIYLSRNK